MEEEFFGRLQSLGKPKAKKKRGGIAGIWDRNKGAIGSIAGAALGNLLLPGAGGMAIGKLLGGAAGGALARGRLDAGQAVGDAFMGSGVVNATGAARRGLGNLLGRSATQTVTTPGMGASAANAVRVADPVRGGTVAIGGRATGGMTARAGTGMGATMGRVGEVAGRIGQAGQRGLSGVLEFIKENPEATGLGLQALSGVMSAQEERRIEEARLEEERRKSRNLGMLAAPIFRETFGGSR